MEPEKKPQTPWQNLISKLQEDQPISPEEAAMAIARLSAFLPADLTSRIRELVKTHLPVAKIAPPEPSAPPNQHVTPIVSPPVRRSVADVLGQTNLEKARGVWGQLSNEHLKKEINRLTGDEKHIIDELSTVLERDASVVYVTVTKPLGTTRKIAGEIDHCAFNARGTMNQDDLKNLWSQIPQQYRESAIAHNPVEAKGILASVLPHPSDSQKKILYCNFVTTFNTSPYDHRGCSTRVVMIVPSDSPILTYLDEGKNLRLWPFIYRNAVMMMHPDAGDFVNAPLSGKHELLGEDRNPIHVSQTENLRLTSCLDTRNAGAPSTTYQAEDLDAFRKKMDQWGQVGSNELLFWPPITLRHWKK